jgi:hypothetical protein
MRNKYRNKKLTLRRKGGGILDSLKETFSNWSTKISQSASNAWNQTKKATGINGTGTSYTPQQPSYSSVVPPNNSYSTSSSTPSTSTSTSTSSMPPNYTTYGGKRHPNKKRNKTYKKRGGSLHDNISLTNIASNAAPFSGETARPHTMVGGPVRMLGGSKSKKNHKKSKKLHK